MELTTEEKEAIDSILKPEASETSKTFVVLTGCEKQDILNPDVLGPFESYRAAYLWIAELRNANIAVDGPWKGEIYLEPIDGGYAGFAIVNEGTAGNPKEYMASSDELYEP
jgi:hypothetical protein